VDRRLVPIPMSLTIWWCESDARPGGSCIWKPGQGLQRPTGSQVLGQTFGRGAMTNGWVDMKTTDMMLIMGGNPARIIRAVQMARRSEAHADRKNDLVDPRFTRTSAGR